MKRILLLFFISVLYLSANSQTIVSQSIRRLPADTNIVAYNDSGKELRYYQYIKLLNTGQYSLTSKGEPGTKGVSYLKKISPERAAQLYAIIKTRMATKSPLLQEGMVLDISPLLSVFKKKDLAGKAIVLLFWNVNCPSCTDSFSTYNDFFKSISDRKDIIVIALTGDDERLAITQLKETPLLYAQIKNDGQQIIKAYQIDSYPSYVVADKNHVITYAISGQAPMAIAMFKNSINKVLQ